MRRTRATIAAAALLAAVAPAPPAHAQLPGVPLPPVGPPGGSPPPENPPPPPRNDPQTQPPAAQPAGSPPTGSVTAAVDPAHTNYVDDPNLVPPLRPRWTRVFRGDVCDSRAAEGRIFVADSTIGRAATLRAVDPVTGRDIWAHPIAGCGGIGYDAGRLFVVENRAVRAYSAADGSLLWQHEMSASGAAPVAAGGKVLVAGGGAFALSQSDGHQLWYGPASLQGSVVAVAGDRVFANGNCVTSAFALADGKQAWRTESNGGCSLDDSVAAVFGQRVFASDDGAVLDRGSGRLVGNVKTSEPQILARGLRISMFNGEFTGSDAETGARKWRRREKPQSGPLAVAPTAVGHSVYRLSPRGRLYSLDVTTGAPQWNVSIPQKSGAHSIEGELAVAPGLLLVPTQRRLTAWESVHRPTERGIAFAPTSAITAYLRRDFVNGVVGTGLRHEGARVRLEYRETGSRRWRTAASGKVEPDGFFEFTVRTRVNTRFRTRSGGVVSRARTIYTFPAIRFRVRRIGPNRIRAAFTARTVRRIRLGGRPASLYIARIRRGRLVRLERLGSTRLSRRGGGRATGSITFRALRRVGRRDYLTVCIKGVARLGIGQPNRFERACGRRWIRF